MSDVKGLEENKVSTWQSDVDPTPEISIDASCLPLVHVNGESVLRMFWFDAFEDHLKQPGIVFLFGKVWAESAKQHVSCCVSVRNIERRVYLLPRRYRVNVKTSVEDQSSPVTFLDVYQVSRCKMSKREDVLTTSVNSRRPSVHEGYWWHFSCLYWRNVV